jgi:hypothetical protein
MAKAIKKPTAVTIKVPPKFDAGKKGVMKNGGKKKMC